MENGYKLEGLVSHDEKEENRVSKGTFWGAFAEGDVGRTCAPMAKGLAQLLLTLLVIRLRAAPPPC